jgi:hypothetical protein
MIDHEKLDVYRVSLEIARGSALESAAVLDEFYIMRAMDQAEINDGKGLLERIVSMLKRMTE